MWNYLLKEYFSFSRKERTGIYTLIILVILCSAMPRFVSWYRRADAADTLAFRQEVLLFEAALAKAAPGRDTAAAINLPSTLFYFDPNRIAAADWLRLGVSERTAGSIQRYLSKGGHFRKPEDLRRIYGMPPPLADKLVPYVRIAEREQITVPDKRQYRKSPPILDINKADTLLWDELPGIGPGFARRICKFRDKLGGFYSIAQVAETYGLPDSVFNKIKPFLKIGDSSLKIMDLNLTDEKTLASHPYIRYKLAGMIVAYRNAHAGFRSMEELRSLPLVDDVIYRKLEYYIQIKP
ncbi:ComEA family DNA-binding protein [Chitinophaga sp. sic0106]|uniref:ComEA family DNA-binding protein n=1 Tax=Chitinophaga sp. sic0106 TaxID=2854785 RepID=UPI001C4595C2|nr:helix-hairpin-helix domain-containing protein [Chitinophaga sp. sic0106]MBV7532645.1 helix-hairpin-helix domain-containing protein [Chitinophaga sp. sic0106]